MAALPAYVLSLGGEVFGQGEVLSPTVRASLEGLMGRVKNLMAESKLRCL